MKLEKCYQPNCGVDVELTPINHTNNFFVCCPVCGYSSISGPKPQAIAAHNRGFWAVEYMNIDVTMHRRSRMESPVSELNRVFNKFEEADKAARGE